MSTEFSEQVVKVPEYYAFCEKHGYSKDQVITSVDFEKDRENFDSAKLTSLGIMDPDFSREMPSDKSILKSVLPFAFRDGSVFTMVYGQPNVIVKPHAHAKPFLRVVMFGEYTFHGLPCGDITLGVGSWIYIPKDQQYGYKTGPQGGGGGCCYCCWP